MTIDKTEEKGRLRLVSLGDYLLAFSSHETDYRGSNMHK